MVGLTQKHENLLFRETDIISFDVFDTVITRTTAEPAGIFLKLQKRLIRLHPDLPPQLLECFANERIDAERMARQNKVREEITLSDIYEQLGSRYDLSDEILRYLMNTEIETELESVRPVPSNARLIRELRKCGKKIIFLSDMYLPKRVIQKLLQKTEIIDEKDEVYVSSEYGLTKSTGNLYLQVLASEKCPPRRLLHIGNNCKSDYLMAKKVGKVRAYHFNDGQFTRYEDIIRESKGGRGHELDWQLIAGASRLARLMSYEENDTQRRTLYEVGANIVGPILWGFVEWVLEQAISRKIERLYFVARDGQILYEMAMRICAATNNDIKLKYLYGSRQAWHLPALGAISDRELHWITVKDPYLSLRLVASRLCLDPEKVLSHLIEDGFPKVNIDDDLSTKEIMELKMILLRNIRLQSLILAQAEKKRHETIAYLRQEGLFDNSDWVIVDSGWNGRLQTSLDCILRLGGRERHSFGFYLGLLSPVDPPGSKEAYLFSAETPASYRQWGPSVLNLLELMMSADHGITMGYKKNGDDQWEPVLKESPHDLMDDLGLRSLRKGVSCFLERLDVSSIQLDHDRFREKIIHLLREFYLSPSRAVARALGRLPFSTDQFEKKFLSFAPALSFKDACRFAFSTFSRERFAITFWIHGSRVQSSLFTNLILSIMSLSFRSLSRIRKHLQDRLHRPSL